MLRINTTMLANMSTTRNDSEQWDASTVFLDGKSYKKVLVLFDSLKFNKKRSTKKLVNKFKCTKFKSYPKKLIYIT